MSLFLVIFFPMMYFILRKLDSTGIKFFYEGSIKPFLLSILSASIYCFCDLLFVSSYRHVPDSFFLNALHFYLFDLLIPFAAGFLLVFITTRKSIFHRILTLLPYYLGFFAIHMVYTSLFKYEKTDLLLLIGKPVFFFFTIFSIWVLICLFAVSLKDRGPVWEKILIVFIALLISFIPASIEALNFLKILPALKIVLMVLSPLIGIFFFFVFASTKMPEEY